MLTLTILTCGAPLAAYTEPLCSSWWVYSTIFALVTPESALALAIAAGMLWSFRALVLQHGRFALREKMCREYFRCVAQAMTIYASENDGRYPDHLSLLTNHIVRTYQVTMFRCPVRREEETPNSNGALQTDFVYMPGLSTSSPPGTVLMYCPPKNHRGRSATILYADGSVETCDPQRFARLVDKGKD